MRGPVSARANGGGCGTASGRGGTRSIRAWLYGPGKAATTSPEPPNSRSITSCRPPPGATRRKPGGGARPRAFSPAPPVTFEARSLRQRPARFHEGTILHDKETGRARTGTADGSLGHNPAACTTPPRDVDSAASGDPPRGARRRSASTEGMRRGLAGDRFLSARLAQAGHPRGGAARIRFVGGPTARGWGPPPRF